MVSTGVVAMLVAVGFFFYADVVPTKAGFNAPATIVDRIFISAVLFGVGLWCAVLGWQRFRLG